MTRELTLLTSLIVVGAGWVLVHLMLLARTTRAARLSNRLRLLAWLPPATPLVGWVAGARALGVLWLVQALLYAWLHSLA
jgi:hypothetical protein